MLEILLPIAIGISIMLGAGVIAAILYGIYKISPQTIMVLLFLAVGSILLFLIYALGLLVQLLMGSPFPC